ncbi:MAG: SEC-C metal-binding domain-containing protein [Candidatus Pacearchaeota archaeon]|jgi:hypothetical protein
MFATTPKEINGKITEFCKEIDSTTKPIFVELLHVEDYICGECYGNVDNHIRKHGGDIQYGWIIWEHPDVLLDAEFHAVWVDDKGEYIDVTPKVDGEKKILFLPDSKRVFTGEELIDNIRKPLVDNDYTKLIIKTSRDGFEMKNKAYKEFLKPKKRKIGVNEPCPCGSGKKYKKCCRTL